MSSSDRSSRSSSAAAIIMQNGGVSDDDRPPRRWRKEPPSCPPTTLQEFMDHLFPHPKLPGFVSNLYGPTYKAKFQSLQREPPAKAKVGKNGTISLKTRQLSDRTIKAIFCREEVLSFLAPHEILSLWRTCRSCWLICPKRRYRVMLGSVFRYLRISEEAAMFVQTRYAGGWKVFLPLLVQMCEYLVTKVYGWELEPDVAHRTYIAEQACFYGTTMAVTDGGLIGDQSTAMIVMGKLASYEANKFNSGGFTTSTSNSNSVSEDEDDDDDILESGGVNIMEESCDSHQAPPTSMPLPSLQDLFQVSCGMISWGHPEYNDAELSCWLEEHRRYMQKQVRMMEDGNHEEYNAFVRAELLQGSRITGGSSSSPMDTEEEEDEADEESQSKQWHEEQPPVQKKPRTTTTRLERPSVLPPRPFSKPNPIEGLAKNALVRRRIRQGLHPNIWFAYWTESPGPEIEEDLFLIGPNLEQIRYDGFSSTCRLASRPTESFATCMFPPDQGGSNRLMYPEYEGELSHGMVGFIIRNSKVWEPFRECDVVLGMCIWCKRHAIPPFDNPAIDWEAIVVALSPSEDVDFYLDALTSTDYGPANLAKYKSLLN